jgi:large subunit ribosomal protein L10
MPFLKIKGGVMGGQPLTAKEVDSLSKLPSREVLLAQFLGLLQATPQALVTVLSGVIRNFLSVLVAIRDQKGSGETKVEAAESVGEEAPAAAAEGLGEAQAAATETVKEKIPAAAAETGEGEAPPAESESGPEKAPATEPESGASEG